MFTRISRIVISIFMSSSFLFFASCTREDSLTSDVNSSGDVLELGGDYLSKDGSLKIIASENRGNPVEFQANTYFEDTSDSYVSQDLLGKVVVINFWYAACGPCRSEAADLEAFYQEFQSQELAFLGVNVRDREKTALAFQRNFGITYPIIDGADGAVLAALSSEVPQQAIPTTALLDRQGRIAARVIGIVDLSTLRSVVQDLLVEV